MQSETEKDVVKVASEAPISSELLGRFIDEISDGFYILDREWRFRYLNIPALKYFGRQTSEMIGRALWEVFPTTVGSQFEVEFRRATKERRSTQFAVQSVARPGRWVEMRAHPLEDGLAVFFLDVTEREIARLALQRSEAQLRLIVDAAPTLISYIDRSYRYRLVNKTYESWFGRARKDILGLTVRELAGEQIWSLVEPHIVIAMAGKTVSFQAEVPYVTGARWIHATYTPHRDASGAVVGVMMLIADISSQKRIEADLRDSEAYHRSLFDAAGVGNTEVELESGRFVRVNRKCCEMFGYSERELIGGMTFYDITHPEDRDKNRDELFAMRRGELQRSQLEKRYIRKDGTILWGYVTTTCLLGSDGRPARFIGVVQDVTERKEAEEALRRAVEELRQINEVAPVGLWVSRDPMCEVITGNPAAQRLYESGPGENVSRGPARDSVGGESRKDVRRRFFDCTGRELSASELPMQQAVMRNSEVRDRLVTFQQPSGRIRTMLGSAVPLRDERGEVRGCVAAFMDVTARVETERALQESEERLRLAVTAAGVGYWSLDLQSKSYVMDETCAGMFQVRRVGSLDDVRRAIVAEDIPKLENALGVALSSAKPFHAELRVRNQGGERRWIACLGDVWRDETGRPVRMFGVTVDLTERKRTEEERQKFVSLAENSTEFIGMFDLNGVPFFVNDAGLKLVGLMDIAEARRIPIRELFFPEDQDFIQNKFLPRVLREGKGEVEIRFRHFRTGEPRWVIHNVFPLMDSDNCTVGFATVSRDITDRRDAEQLLKHADRRKDEFLATLAHELRNPLAPISNALQIWPRIEKDPGQSVRIREMMERQVKQLKRLIDDLLDVSRISRGKIQLREEKKELSEILEGTIEGIRLFVDACGHKLAVKLPDYSVVVKGDVGRLMQVFGNLIHNAAKYTDHGGLILVSCEAHDGQAIVKVKDNGSGIPQEMLESIFEPFAQVNVNLDRAQGGLGIGLTLVKTLVEMHGGTVQAISQGPGLGSEFTITLPLTRGMNRDFTHGELQREGRPADAPRLARRRVLIVDDLKPSADTLALMLEELGQDTRVAYDGRAALDIARDFRPDVVLSDIAMPGMDGYHLAERLRTIEGESPVLVALTGYGQEHDRARAYEAGFSHHLVKPTTLESVRQILAKSP
jgi:PAS domain S-box-containing protein